MFKKWWFYVIIAVVIIIIAVPLATIIRLNNSVYDLNYNYVQYDDLLTELAKKHVYYEAETTTLEVEINQDLINSLLKDQLATMDLGLPEKLSIQDVVFNTADQRIYINAKYGSINLPISALVHIEPDDSGINIYADSINLGDKKAPGFIANQIPLEQLQYSIKYSDLGVPQIFTVKDIVFSTGNMNVFIELDVEAIKALARDYRDDLLVSINQLKATAPEAIATFIDKALDEGVLSDENVNKYVEQVLGNEELVNSAVLFAVAPDLDKYSKSIESYQKAIEEWAAPLSTIKLDGTLEETVDSILYNQELQEMLAWFIPESTLSEYVDTADTYYSTITSAINSLDFDGTLEGTLDTLLYNRSLHNALTLFIPAATLNEYIDTADQYYTAYRKATNSLNKLSRTLEQGDIEAAINQLVADRELYSALSLVIPTDSIDYYVDSISGYYQLYADVTQALTEALDSIPDEEIDKFVNDAVEFVKQIDNGKEYLANLIAGLDTQSVQAIIEYVNQDEGLIKQQLNMIHPAYYNEFMHYVENLDAYRDFLISSIKSADVSAVTEGAEIINSINKDLLNVLDLLKKQEYEKAGEAMGKISFEEAEKFIEEQSALVQQQF